MAKEAFRKLTDQEIDEALTPMAKAFVKAWQRRPRSWDKDENEDARHAALNALHPYDALPRRPKSFSASLKEQAWNRLNKLIDNMAKKTAKKTAKKATAKKTSKKASGSKPKSFLEAIERAQAVIIPEDEWRKKHRLSKLDFKERLANYVSTMVNMLLEAAGNAFPTDEPHGSPRHVRKAVVVLGSAVPSAEEAAYVWLDNHPRRVAELCAELTRPSFRANDPRYLEGFGASNIGEFREVLDRLLEEEDAMRIALAQNYEIPEDAEESEEEEEEEEEEEDEDEDEYAIERFEREGGTLSPELRHFVDTLGIEQSIHVRPLLSNMSVASEILASTFGSDFTLAEVQTIARLISSDR